MKKITLSKRLSTTSSREAKRPLTAARRSAPDNQPSKPKVTSTIRLMIVDDHTFIREALRSLVELDKSIEIIGEADNGRKAVDLAVEKRPPVLLMDIGMPRLNGLAAARQIRQLAPDVRIILLTAHCLRCCSSGSLLSGKGWALKIKLCGHELSIPIFLYQ